jgi:hypothetical protein
VADEKPKITASHASSASGTVIRFIDWVLGGSPFLLVMVP